MAVRSWIRRQFKNGVIVTDTIPTGCSAVALSITLADGTSFPDGSVGPFICTLDPGLASEEKVLVDSRSGAVLTIDASGRGYNGTTAFIHGSNAVVWHTLDQQDLDEANQVAFQTLGAIQASGDLLQGSSANNLARLARGASGTVLSAGASVLSWVTTVISFNGRSGVVVPTSGDYTAAQVTNAADKSSATTQTFTAGLVTGNSLTASFNVTGQTIIAQGIGASIAAARWVGCTASGAPGSGTYLLGDFIVDQTGRMWVCTVAGTPGTWKDVGLIDLTAANVEALFTAAGQMFVGTGSGTGSLLAVGAAGTHLVSTGAAAPSWAVPPGTLLSTALYAPGTVSTYTLTTTLAALDTTNLTLAFTVPANGIVDVVAEFLWSGASGSLVGCGLKNHSGGAQLGLTKTVGFQNAAGVTLDIRSSVKFHLTGLTPGALQVDFAAGSNVGATSTISAIGAAGNQGASVLGEFLMQAIASV